MNKIVPHLWFDTQAAEAAEFYARTLPDSEVTARIPLPGTPSGDAELVAARFCGQDFLLLSAGPLFRFTPAVSFLVACESDAEVDRLHAAFSAGGTELMPLGPYPFAERYAWVMDRWGLSWQVMHRRGHRPAQRITPTLMFVGPRCGKAEEASRFYAGLFDGAVDGILRYPEGAEPDRPGTIQHLEFQAAGQTFAAMDSAHDHEFGFNEAVSLLVNCDTQEEIDRLWSALSADPEAEACGWLKDRFGLSWQISPSFMNEAIQDPDPVRLERFLKVMLSQKKFDLVSLKAGWQG